MNLQYLMLWLKIEWIESNLHLQIYLTLIPVIYNIYGEYNHITVWINV